MVSMTSLMVSFLSSLACSGASFRETTKLKAEHSAKLRKLELAAKAMLADKDTENEALAIEMEKEKLALEAEIEVCDWCECDCCV